LENHSKRIVIALGGNVVTPPHHKGTYEEQFSHVRSACRHIVEFVRQGFEVVLTHGNGPQVGNLLIQQEAGAAQVPPQPMDVCNAMTQGQLGYALQRSLVNELKAHDLNSSVITVLTQVVVDRNDPDFSDPTKPVGPFYNRKDKERLESERGYRMKKVQSDGAEPFRRVVPSPDPVRIVEAAALKKLVDAGMLVVAAGGGGIPVCLSDRGELEGVEGVVDKDLAAEKLAEAVGANWLVILTDVQKVKLGFGTTEERDIERMSAAEAEIYLRRGEFGEGSMAPKITACIRFVERGGEAAIITSLDRAWTALQSRSGTYIFR
jgi:carbamate kinase